MGTLYDLVTKERPPVVSEEPTPTEPWFVKTERKIGVPRLEEPPVPLIQRPEEIEVSRLQKVLLTPIAPTEFQQKALIAGFRTVMEGWRRITEVVKAPLYEYQRAVIEKRPTLDPTLRAIPEALKGLRYTPGTEIIKNMGVPLDDPKWVLENPGKHFAAQMLGAWYETYGTDPIILGLWAKSVPYARKANLFNQIVKETGKKLTPAMIDRATVPIPPKIAKELSKMLSKGFWGRQAQVAGGLKKVSERELKLALKAIRDMKYAPEVIPRLGPPEVARLPALIKPPEVIRLPSPTVRPSIPEITKLKEIVKKAGGEWVGIWEKPSGKKALQFNDPISHTTLDLPIEKATIENIKAKMAERKKVFKPALEVKAIPKELEPLAGLARRMEIDKKAVRKYPLALLKEHGFETYTEFIATAKRTKPIELPEEIKLATRGQKAQAHIVAKEKALITPEGKTKPQYRRLARVVTGQPSMKDMTEIQAKEFITALKKISEPYYKKGRLVPPSIPRTTYIVPKGFFEKKFREPTIARLLTSQIHYSDLLGVKPFVEPLEIAKQEFDLVYRKRAMDVDIIIKKINKLAKTTTAEIMRAKIKNIPTKAVSKMRDLLDTYEEPPAFLTSGEKEIFNWFRSLNRTTLEAENVVREALDINPIKYRKAYVRHIAESMAQEMLMGKYPFPQNLKYWSQKVIGKKIYNPMEFQRRLADDLQDLWTKDLAHATKSMLWTALKEVHFSQPLKVFTEQLGAYTKDPAVYKHLTPEEREIYALQTTMPSSTRKWLIDYVNQAIKGQETDIDASVNRIITTSGLRGVFNKILAPIGRTVGKQPVTRFFQTTGRLTIHGVMGPIRPKQLIRNKFQLIQNLALYNIKSNLKGFLPDSKPLKDLKAGSLFLKGYTGFEDLPVNLMGKLERLNLALYQWTAVSNASQSMSVAYHHISDKYINTPKKAKYGWADPKRTYKEPEDFLYPSEKEKILKEMEFGAGATQYGYIPLQMPEIFRYKALIPFTRLQSWWMNHFFRFNREAIMRFLKGQPGWSDGSVTLDWADRVNWLKYLVIGGIVLNTLGYERSFLFGAAPSGLPPVGQLMLGLYTYLTVGEKTDWQKKRKAEAKRRIFYALRTFIPGYLSWTDFNALMSGEKQLKEYLFYKKFKKKERVPPLPRPEGKRPPEGGTLYKLYR